MRAVARTDWLRNWLLARLIGLGVVVLAFVQVAQAQTQSAAGVKAEEEALSLEVNDPTAMLTQVRLLDFYTPGNFQTSSQTNASLIQPIIPIARLPFLPFEQIVRPTFKFSLVAPGPGAHPVTAFADVQLYDLIQSQWPHLDRLKMRWAIGSTYVFPTATDFRAGAGSWQAGPAAALAFAGVPRLWLGLLAQNPISFAYTRPGAKTQNTMLFQPGFSYRLYRGWYVKSTDSVWTINWRHRTSTTIPVSIGFGKVWMLNGQLVDSWVSGEWMAYRQLAGITPMYTVRFGFNLLFPEFVLGRQ